MNIYDELAWRGLIYDGTEGVREHLAEGPVTVYIGFDPTASSLHVGSLLQIMNLARMQRAGHRVVALVGGGTGLIGDPSGKSKEREMLSAERVAENVAGVRSQLERFLDFESAGNPAQLVDNGEWLNSVGLVEFLRDIGKHFTVNYMLAKESVSRRLAQEEGISFTEFSYLLLQAYDFLILHRQHGCTLQMGGSDQWGNITAGTELIRRLDQSKAHGLVVPLVTTSSGQKFGKTEAGAVWLDAERTSPYRYYQFWLNSSDQDTLNYLRYFTFLSQEEIEALARSMEEEPGRREAQKTLARELTVLTHGEAAYARALRSSEVLFGAELGDLSPEEILDIFEDVPSSSLDATELERDLPLIELLASSGLVASKGAAKRLLRDGGAYVNNLRADPEHTVRRDDFLGDRVLVLRQGRKKYHLVTLRAH